jgi:hypothetical protein
LGSLLLPPPDDGETGVTVGVSIAGGLDVEDGGSVGGVVVAGATVVGAGVGASVVGAVVGASVVGAGVGASVVGAVVGDSLVGAGVGTSVVAAGVSVAGVCVLVWVAAGVGAGAAPFDDGVSWTGLSGVDA